MVRGKIAAHRDGFAWLLPQDGSADVYLHDRALGSAMDGDEVLVRITGTRRDGKPEGPSLRFSSVPMRPWWGNSLIVVAWAWSILPILASTVSSSCARVAP